MFVSGASDEEFVLLDAEVNPDLAFFSLIAEFVRDSPCFR